MTKKEKIKWIIKKHSDTNHMYDKYLPYEFHLRMVRTVSDEFEDIVMNRLIDDQTHPEDFELALYGHDLIEDTRTNYNEVKDVLGKTAADIIYAVTNEKGKTRTERANDRYYDGIRNVNGAIYVKLCDRIANVQYSKMTGSSMYEKYKKENSDFIKKLGIEPQGVNVHQPIVEKLLKLFE